MTLARCVGIWLFVALSACSQVEFTPTQIMLRISSTDAALLAQTTELRAAAAIREEPGFRTPVTTRIEKDRLRWPVDLPVFPRNAGDMASSFEVVVEARDGERVLAQTRARSSFVRGRRLLLQLFLTPCAGLPSGVVCSSFSCVGESCLVCSPEGECVPQAAAIDPNDLPDQSDASVEGSGSDRDAGMDASRAGDTGGPLAADAEAGGARVMEAGLGGTSDRDGSLAPLATCQQPNVCTPDFPCLDSPDGYVCRGQLADWRVADVAPSYSMGPNGLTITDNITHLTWQRMLPAIYEGCSTSCVPQDAGPGCPTSPPGAECNWADATAYCNNLVLGGYDDWRLPTKIELESIIDFARTNPAIDTASFPIPNYNPNFDAQNYGSQAFWTSTRLAMVPDSVWYVGFAWGASHARQPTHFHRVRCVR